MHALPSCPIASHCTQVLAHAGGVRVRASGKWQVWLRASAGALKCWCAQVRVRSSAGALKYCESFVYIVAPVLLR